MATQFIILINHRNQDFASNLIKSNSFIYFLETIKDKILH